MPAFAYWAYGLCVTCDEPLGGLVPAPPDATPDLWIQLRDEGDREPSDLQDLSWRLVRTQMPLSIWAAPSATGPAFRLRYGPEDRHVEFTIARSGSRVRARWTEECTIEDVEALLVGPILTCALRARGATCLHASVVAIDGFAVAVTGDAGAGKSTTAAGLLRLGARALADDLAVIVEQEGRFLVQQGPRRLRLNPDSASALGMQRELPRVWPALPDRPERRYLDVQGEAVDHSVPPPAPLAAIYFLAAGGPAPERPAIESLTTACGLATLLSNATASFMLPELGAGPEFDRLAKLARSVPVRAMHRPKGIEHLAAVCRAIRDDAVELARRSELVPA